MSLKSLHRHCRCRRRLPNTWPMTPCFVSYLLLVKSQQEWHVDSHVHQLAVPVPVPQLLLLFVWIIAVTVLRWCRVESSRSIDHFWPRARWHRHDPSLAALWGMEGGRRKGGMEGGSNGRRDEEVRKDRGRRRWWSMITIYKRVGG